MMEIIKNEKESNISSLNIIVCSFNVSTLKLSKETDQIMLVYPHDETSTLATFLFYIKEGNRWKEIINSKAYVGKEGIGKTKEGISVTPIGSFKFTKFFGILDNPGTKLEYTKINKNHYWISDSTSERYNQFVDINEYDEFDKEISEH